MRSHFSIRPNFYFFKICIWGWKIYIFGTWPPWNMTCFRKMYLFSAPNKNFRKQKLWPDRETAADSKDIFSVPVLQTGEELCQLKSRNSSIFLNRSKLPPPIFDGKKWYAYISITKIVYFSKPVMALRFLKQHLSSEGLKSWERDPPEMVLVPQNLPFFSS